MLTEPKSVFLCLHDLKLMRCFLSSRLLVHGLPIKTSLLGSPPCWTLESLQTLKNWLQFSDVKATSIFYKQSGPAPLQVFRIRPIIRMWAFKEGCLKETGAKAASFRQQIYRSENRPGNKQNKPPPFKQLLVEFDVSVVEVFSEGHV